MAIPGILYGAAVLIMNVSARLTPLMYTLVTGATASSAGVGMAATAAILRQGAGRGRVLAWLARVLPRQLQGYKFTAVMRNGQRIAVDNPSAARSAGDIASRIAYLEAKRPDGFTLALEVSHATPTAARSALETAMAVVKSPPKIGAREIGAFAELPRLVVRPLSQKGSAQPLAEAQHVSRQVWNLVESFEKRGALDPAAFNGPFGGGKGFTAY